MRLPFQLLALAVVVLLPLADARSSKRNPIRVLRGISNATIHTHNHRVTALSQFDLTFNTGFDLNVKLNLEPNHNILADDATVAHLAPDGTVTQKETVNRLDHKVYKGTAWIQWPSIGENEWRNVGWARVTVRKDGEEPLFEGAFVVNDDHYHIQGSSNYVRTRHRLDPDIPEFKIRSEYMVLWRDSDILPDSQALEHEDLRRSVADDVSTCQADGLSFNTNPEHPVFLGMKEQQSKRSYGAMDVSQMFSKRQIDSTTGGNSAGVNLKSTIGNSAGCPTTNKVALVGVATDCNYAGSFGSTQAARENVISQMNTASAIWEKTFKISLGIQNLTMTDSNCPAEPAQATEWNQACSNSVNIEDRLNYFSAWRGTQQDGNSHWTLLSTCNTGGTIGLAWLGQACVNTATSANYSMTGNGASTGTETVSGANVVIRTEGANEWQIIAHETGHTFGAVHDCVPQTCADANYVASQQCCPYSTTSCDSSSLYIMDPDAAQGISSFSACTVGNICSAIGRNSVNTDCLSDNKDVSTITGQQCGNGIVEPGEECDCGGTEGCEGDTCCDPTTCKFTAGSVCDDANEDCCNKCQYESKGTVCRPSTGPCDPQEVCAGNVGNCPPDKTAPNGQSCGSGLNCASGECTSRDEQCKTVMGSYTKGNDTHACDSEGCTISCASPQFGYGVCYGLQQNFLDGTECGGGGHCQNVSTV